MGDPMGRPSWVYPLGPPVSTGGRFRRALGLPPSVPRVNGGKVSPSLGSTPSVSRVNGGKVSPSLGSTPSVPVSTGGRFRRALGLPPRSPVSTGGRFRRALHNAKSQAKLRVPSIKHPGAMEWREPPARPYPEDRKTVADAWATHRVAPAMRIVWRAPVTAQQTGVDRVRDRVRVFPAARHARPSRRCAPRPPRR